MNDLFIFSEDGRTILSVTDKNIKNIVIPNGVTKIGEGVFDKSFAFKSITIHCKDIESIDFQSFFYVDYDKCVLHIPLGTKSAYKNHPIFKYFKNIVMEQFD